MADIFQQWDLDVQAPGVYTPWDDVAGGPNESKWDLQPSNIGDGVKVRWVNPGRMARWLDPGRRIKWLFAGLSRLITVPATLWRWGVWRLARRTATAMT